MDGPPDPFVAEGPCPCPACYVHGCDYCHSVGCSVHNRGAPHFVPATGPLPSVRFPPRRG